MELIFQDQVFTLGDFSVVLFASAFFIVAPLGIYYYKKEYGKADKDELKVIRVLFLIGVSVLFCILLYSIHSELFYMVEKRIDNVETKVVVIETVTASNKGCEIIDSNDTLYNFFGSDSGLREILENNFLNRTCEIEYYKWSKFVKRLKVIE